MATRDEYNGVNWHAALDAYIEHAPRQESVQSLEEEAERERRYYEFETACIEFAKLEGWANVSISVGRAMKYVMAKQGSLFCG